MCRASAGDCDLPEYCTGASPHCPDDSFHMNGKPCYNQAEGFCHDGRCPTHQHHCWRLFGPGTHGTPGTPSALGTTRLCFHSAAAAPVNISCFLAFWPRERPTDGRTVTAVDFQQPAPEVLPQSHRDTDQNWINCCFSLLLSCYSQSLGQGCILI